MKAIVIGAGFGGLAAAIRLGARGYEVEVFERLEQAGGKASVFRQDGFVFDAGPTIITAPHLFEDLWALAGRDFASDIDLVEMDPFYRIVFSDGTSLDCSGDEQKMKEQITLISADDVGGYDEFLKRSKAIFEVGFERLAHTPFTGIGSMIAVLPSLIRLRGDKSVYELAAVCFKDPRLRLAFSFHPLLVGGNPLRTTSVYSLIAYLECRWGVHFVMGGTGVLVEGMLDLIRQQGGKIHLNTPVSEILVRQGRAAGIALSSGARVVGDVIVSNVDSVTTYNKLLPTVNRKRWTEQRLNRQAYSMGLFVWYFGTKRLYPSVPHHTMLMCPRYEDLLTDIFERHCLGDEFSLYLHRPTATDSSLAPEGCESFYALVPVPNLDGDFNWQTRADEFRQRVETHLENTLLPGLRQALVTSRVMTPYDFRTRYDAPRGAAFGLAPELLQSAWFRPHNVSEEVDGLYLVGAGTHPGAGVPGVLSSARVVDEVIAYAH